MGRKKAATELDLSQWIEVDKRRTSLRSDAVYISITTAGTSSYTHFKIGTDLMGTIEGQPPRFRVFCHEDEPTRILLVGSKEQGYKTKVIGKHYYFKTTALTALSRGNDIKNKEADELALDSQNNSIMFLL